jgi:hypothetical protein
LTASGGPQRRHLTALVGGGVRWWQWHSMMVAMNDDQGSGKMAGAKKRMQMQQSN